MQHLAESFLMLPRMQPIGTKFGRSHCNKQTNKKKHTKKLISGLDLVILLGMDHLVFALQKKK